MKAFIKKHRKSIQGIDLILLIILPLIQHGSMLNGLIPLSMAILTFIMICMALILWVG